MEASSSRHIAPPSAILQQQLEPANIEALHIQGEKGPHDIFLSHSGQEKGFVEKLDRALRNAGYDPFFDKLSIPPGKHFPSHILQNAKKCKLGVVVLSPGYLTSKWPMLELCTMSTSPDKPILLPLFFRIQPYELKLVSPKWWDAWKAFEERNSSRINIREWERAAIQLSNIQGEVYQTHMDEERFIEVVLLRISSIIRPPLRYDVLHLTGHERLTQVVAQKFEEVPATIFTSHPKARTIGFFAIGGQGKTTICKLMVNHYASAYAGRCALIQFPSNDCNEKEVVRQCNKALQQLTNSNVHHIDDFDECLQHMREQTASRNVFIAIDNVWEVCLHFAQRILDVGFSKGSKILVTSRSQQVLSSLLEDASYVKPLPGVNGEEAHQIFVKSFHRNLQAGLGFPLNHADMRDVTNWLQYHGGYHPLTINAVGMSLGRMGGQDWHGAWKCERNDLIGSHSLVDKAIKINFNSIPKPRRDMFLDVALICIPALEGKCPLLSEFFFLAFFAGFNPVSLLSDLNLILLSAIYKEEMDKHEISMNLMQLAYDGLLEFEDSKFHVHDLYKDLANREAAVVSPRFIFVEDNILPDINWAEVERIVSWDYVKGISMPEYINGLAMPKLQILIAGIRIACTSPIHMPRLRILSLFIRRRSRFNMDLRHMPELVWLGLCSVPTVLRRVFKDVSWLRNLCVLVLAAYDNHEDEDHEDELCLDGLVNLQILSINNIHTLQKISGLGSLINLKHICLEKLPQLQRVCNFNSCFTQLQMLITWGCRRLRVDDMVGLFSLPNLRCLQLVGMQLAIESAQCLDFHGMIALESLFVQLDGEGGSAITVNVYGLPKLKTLWMGGKGVVELSFDGLPTLEKLVILDADSLKQLSCDGLPRLESLSIQDAGTLKQLDLCRFKGLTNLTKLYIGECRSLTEIEWSSLNNLTSLARLEIIDCWQLEKIRGEPKGINQTLRVLKIKPSPSKNMICGIHLLTNCQFEF